jgi:subtilisin family serine protease
LCRDCNGHGTHVAGIVGGKDDRFVGVAPDVSFHAYKIFGCVGSTDTSVIMAAMERAFVEGMDLINMVSIVFVVLNRFGNWIAYCPTLTKIDNSNRNYVHV